MTLIQTRYYQQEEGKAEVVVAGHVELAEVRDFVFVFLGLLKSCRNGKDIVSNDNLQME
jgi:hypothetical protein